MVDKPVHGGSRHGGIRKDVIPGGKRLICGDGDAVSFVSMGDELEQDAGLGFVLADIGEVVEDDELVLVELVEGAGERQLAAGGLKPLDHVGGSGEQDTSSGIDDGMADGANCV